MEIEQDNLEMNQISPIESRELELLLFESFKPGQLSEEDVGRDFVEIRNLTVEIRSIHKQQVVLVGERVYRAREILRKYGDGTTTFTQWLDRVFTSRRTAYNILRYYEFYQQLPSLSLRQGLKSMPLKVAYCLSSRQAPLGKKVEIIESYSGEKPEDAILLIKEKLPTAEKDKRRKDSNKLMIEKIKTALHRLKMRREHLTKDHLSALQDLMVDLEEIVH
ncbi:MAG: pGP6-D family virulence protein [Simkaniaceae bacterium]|nr:pGP6-D family virulence protein [Simkaniaceae bacterium]